MHRCFRICIPIVAISTPLLGLGLIQVASPESEVERLTQAELKGQCVSCHKPFVDEWASSRHAVAFSNEHYKKAANAVSSRATDCDTCHAPEQIQVAGIGKMPKFRGRPNVPDRGVMCVCCHMDSEGVMHGPYGDESDFHKTVKDTKFEASNEVCASCHGQTMGVGGDYNQMESFAEYARNLPQATCLDCHMRPVQRPASTELGKPVRRCGEHTWKGAYDAHTLESALTVRTRVSGTTATATVSNSAGHMIPGGAWRQAVVEIVANGKMVKEEVLAREPGGKTDTRLKPYERRKVTGEVPAGATVETRVWWKMMPDTPDAERILVAKN